MKSMSKYFINILGCLGLLMGLSAQETKSNGIDSLVVQKKYGLRVGVDLSKITRSFLDTDYMKISLNILMMVRLVIKRILLIIFL